MGGHDRQRGNTPVADDTTADANQDLDLRSRAMLQRARQRRQASREQRELQQTQARAYKEMLAHKFDNYAGTVDLACALFEHAIINEKLDGKANNIVADIVLDTLFAELQTIILADLMPGLALIKKMDETLNQSLYKIDWLGRAQKDALSAVRKGSKANSGNNNDKEIIEDILRNVKHAAYHFVRIARDQIAAIPDLQAAAQFCILDATVNSDAAEETARFDSDSEGDVKRGLANEILEGMGAPKTGPTEAAHLAQKMLEAYKRERFYGSLEGTSDSEEREKRKNELLDGSAQREIQQAATLTETDKEIHADQRERQRSHQLLPGTGRL